MELLISISIIAILVAIGIVSYSTINKQSRDTKRKSDMEQIRSALEMYRADTGYYPPAGAGAFVAVSGLAADLVTSYITVLPSDPLAAQSYMYKATNPPSPADGNYYGYCLSANMETEDPTDSCTPNTDFNYGVKNP